MGPAYLQPSRRRNVVQVEHVVLAGEGKTDQIQFFAQ